MWCSVFCLGSGLVNWLLSGVYCVVGLSLKHWLVLSIKNARWFHILCGIVSNCWNRFIFSVVHSANIDCLVDSGQPQTRSNEPQTWKWAQQHSIAWGTFPALGSQGVMWWHLIGWGRDSDTCMADLELVTVGMHLKPQDGLKSKPNSWGTAWCLHSIVSLDGLLTTDCMCIVNIHHHS